MADEVPKTGDGAPGPCGASDLTHDLSSLTDLDNDKSDDTDANTASGVVSAHHAMRRGYGWGKGVVDDVRRTLCTHWKEEMTNLNTKVGFS